MSYDIKTVPNYERRVRRLLKHYASLKSDLLDLMEQLSENPMMGVDLGNGFRKVRMKIRSKGKGKSGGARVITHTANVIVSENSGVLYLVDIYDKSVQESVAISKIRKLLMES